MYGAASRPSRKSAAISQLTTTMMMTLSLVTACGLSSAGSGSEGGSPVDPAADSEGGTAAGGHDANGGADGDTDHPIDPGDAASTPDGASTTQPVNLGTAGTFAILSKGGISIVPGAAITGNLGVSPAAATYITGFSLIADATNVFSTSTQVTGKVYAADYALPTPSKLTVAVGDMEAAFTEAGGRAPDVVELGGGDLGGKTLVPGVYQWATGVLVPSDVTLSGSATDVWIFQIAQTLTMSTGAKVLLAGGALAKNVFWQVASSVELGTTAHLEGVLLTGTSVTLGTGASIKGRLLAQTSVSVATSAVIQSGL